mgnify:CR=1 FL=1
MKLKSNITSNKELKKNGYKILRKLHKMERKKGADRAYASCYEGTYMFVLYCKELVDIIKNEYGKDKNIIRFEEKCDGFLRYLDHIAETKSKMNKTCLAGFLKAYTKFFNNVIESNHSFFFDQTLREKWNVKCLMAYIATWGMK